MRKEYDLTRLKVKRRGPLEGLHGVPEAPEVESGQVPSDDGIGQRRDYILRKKSDGSGRRLVYRSHKQDLERAHARSLILTGGLRLESQIP